MALRRVDNPPNPYESAYREYLGPPPEVRLEVYEETARSILTRNESPDIPFTYSVNPYRGCRHACAYCYARTYHEYLGMGAGTDFETRLVAKVNAPTLLRRELRSGKIRGERVQFSGITDCYQPLEATYELTRRCLEVCRDAGQPVAVVTKSFLVARDTALLGTLAREAGAAVCISITFADREMGRLLEPGAPSPERRWEAVQRLARAGVPVGVLVAPIIPGLNDSQVPAILEEAARAGAQSACYTPVRLPGSVQTVFLERLRRVLPLRWRRVQARIRDLRGGRMNESRFGARMRASGTYWHSIQQLFEIQCRRWGLHRGTPAANCPRNPSTEPCPSSPAPSATSRQGTFDFLHESE